MHCEDYMAMADYVQVSHPLAMRQLLAGPTRHRPLCCQQDTDGLAGMVDPAKLILWGTSYSGGHSLVCARCAAAKGRHFCYILPIKYG